MEGIAHDGYTNEMRRVNQKTQEDQKDDSTSEKINNESNFAEQLFAKSQLGDSLLNKKPVQEVSTERSARNIKEDIKVKLRK